MHWRGAILVASPDEAARRGVARTLGGRGFLPLEVGSRVEALSLVREVPVDVALVDAYLPDGLGLSACAAPDFRARAPRVIVMTRDPSRTLRRDALSAGAFAVVALPALPRIVLATVEAALRREEFNPRWFTAG